MINLTEYKRLLKEKWTENENVLENIEVGFVTSPRHFRCKTRRDLQPEQIPDQNRSFDDRPEPLHKSQINTH